jgi:hypothetical protein
MLPRPLSYCESYKQNPAMIAEMDRLLDDYNYADVARILNEKGFKTGDGLPLTYSFRRPEDLYFRGRFRVADLHVSQSQGKNTRPLARSGERVLRGSGSFTAYQCLSAGGPCIPAGPDIRPDVGL